MSQRSCGICGRPPREGESLGKIRLDVADLGDDRIGQLFAVSQRPKEPGLYQACGDCVTAARPVVGARVAAIQGKKPEDLGNNDFL